MAHFGDSSDLARFLLLLQTKKAVPFGTTLFLRY